MLPDFSSLHARIYSTRSIYMNSKLLLIFVKHPVPGRVKTRLAADVGDEAAVRIYQQLLGYTLSLTQPLEVDNVVFYGNKVPETDLWQKAGYPRYLQEGPTLGDRMEQAFTWGFDQGYQEIAIIGSDCAELTTDILTQAFDILLDHNAVIGPAHDGGYYLLGMKHLIPGVFQRKYWSTSTVFAATIRDFELAEISYKLLPTLSDVDTVEDLKGTFLELEGMTDSG